ncbi:MAG: hypothetical protein AAF335_00620 [Bacteroidota bacterium]
MNYKNISYKLLICLLIAPPTLATQKKNILVLGQASQGKDVLIGKLKGGSLTKERYAFSAEPTVAIITELDKKQIEGSTTKNRNFIHIDIPANSTPQGYEAVHEKLSKIKEPIHGILIVCSAPLLESQTVDFKNYIESSMLLFKIDWEEILLRTCFVITMIDRMEIVASSLLERHFKRETANPRSQRILWAQTLASYNNFSATTKTGKVIERKFEMVPFDPFNYLSRDGDETSTKKLHDLIDRWNKGIQIKDILYPKKDPEIIEKINEIREKRKLFEKRKAEKKKSILKEMDDLFTTEFEKDREQVEGLVDKIVKTAKKTDWDTLGLSSLDKTLRTFLGASWEIRSETIPALSNQFNLKMSKINHVKDFPSKKEEIEREYRDKLEKIVSSKQKNIEEALLKKLSQVTNRQKEEAKKREEEWDKRDEEYQQRMREQADLDNVAPQKKIKAGPLSSFGKSVRHATYGLTGLVAIPVIFYFIWQKSKGKKKKMEVSSA